MRPSATRWAAVVALFALCVAGAPPSRAETYVLDETLMMPGRTALIDTLTEASDRSAWQSALGQCNGFHLLRRLPSAATRVLHTKSVSLHAKFYGTIFDEDVFMLDGEPIVSEIGPVMPGFPELADFLRQYGAVVFRILTALPIEEPFDSPRELVVWGRDEANRPKVLKIMRNAAAGGAAVFPRDFYREVDQLPLSGPETIFEYRYVTRARYDVTEYGVGDEPITFFLPYRWVVGVSVRHCVIDGSCIVPRGPRLTRVDRILDPGTPICPDESASWFLPDTEPPATGDEGELCFDVDSITSLDEVILPMAGTGALKIALPLILDYLGIELPIPPFDPFQEAFPEVLDPEFDTGPQALFRGYMAARCMMNRGFRLLDTVNPEGGPAIRDVRPLLHGIDYIRDYDGVPLEMGFQVRRVCAPGLRGRELLNAAGAFGLLDLAQVPALFGDYRHLARRVRFYVRGPLGWRREVTLPQLLQLISTKWEKYPAYEPPHNLLEDHPRLDLGQLGPFTFEMTALARVQGVLLAQYYPIRAIISVHPGLYSTNYYGGEPFTE